MSSLSILGIAVSYGLEPPIPLEDQKRCLNGELSEYSWCKDYRIEQNYNDVKTDLVDDMPNCGAGTEFTDGVCVVIPVERGIFMHGPLGPFLLVVLVGIVLSPIYAILKFKKPTNKILFIVSVSIAAIIFSQVIYGEFLLVGDQGVAPSANESFFFALSILGSFFVTISFTMLGAVYWRKNKNPNKMMILTFFIIAMIPIIALMTGFLPRGAEA